MRRIKVSEGGVADPVTGKIVFPLPPAAGVFDPTLANQWQEEIATVIEGAGMTLDETKTNQLQKAIAINYGFFTDTTIQVPLLGGLALALDDLRNRYIAPGVTVTLQLAPGVHVLTKPFVANNPRGDQIVIRGNPSVPAQTELSIRNITPADASGLFMTEGGGKIRFYGVHLTSQNLSVVSQSFATVMAKDGGVIYLDSVKITDVYSRVVLHAKTTGRIEASNVDASGSYLDLSGMDSNTAPLVGFNLLARDSGVIIAKQFTPAISGTIHGVVRAERKGYVHAITGTYAGPIVATNEGTVRAESITHTGPAGFSLFDCAFRAEYGGKIFAKSCKAGLLGASYKIGDGFIAEYNGEIVAESCTVEKCSTGFHSLSGSRVLLTACTVTDCDVGYSSYKASYMRSIGSTAGGLISVAAKSPAAGAVDATTASYME